MQPRQPRTVFGEHLVQLENLINVIKTAPTAPTTHSTILNYLVSTLSPHIACYYSIPQDKRYFINAACHPPDFWSQDHIKSRFDRRPIDAYAIGTAVRTKSPVIIDNPQALQDQGAYLPFDDRIGHEVILPVLAQEAIIGGQKVVGVIVLSRYKGYNFTSDELSLMTFVASIISAVHTHALTSYRRDNHLQFLNSITNLNSLDSDSLYHGVLIGLYNLMPIRLITLWLYDRDNDALVLRSFYPTSIERKALAFSDFDHTILTASESMIGQAIGARRPLIFSDVNSDNRFKSRRFAAAFDLTWCISYPLIDEKNDVVAVVNVWPSPKYGDLDDDTISDYYTYVSHMAYAIRCAALLFAESLIDAFDAVFASMIRFEDHRASWDSLARIVSEQLQCEACSIFLQAKVGLLHLKGTTGLINVTTYESVTYAPGEGLTGYAFQQRTPILYYGDFRHRYKDICIRKYSERLSTSTGPSSIILGQITDMNDKVIGIIRCVNKKEIPSRRRGRFTHEDVTALTQISKLISRIFAKVQLVRDLEFERELSIRSVHHEIVSPLDGIMSHVDWLDRHFMKDPSVWNLDRIRLKSGDMVQIAELISNVSKLMIPYSQERPLDLKLHNIYELIRTSQGFIVNDAKSHGIELDLRPIFVEKVLIDASDMMRVLFNLFRNAIKYHDDNEKHRYLRISACEEDERVKIVFEDNGIGVIPGEREKIFEKFYRGSNARAVAPTGEGLGLFYARQIMVRFGGFVKVDPVQSSKPTRFILVLPIPKRDGL